MDRGNKAFEIQDFRRALKFFKRIIEIDNTNIEALQKFAVCNSFIGKADLAIEYFNKVLELNPDKETKLEILSNLANAFMFKGNETRNHDFYDRAIEINKELINETEDNEGVYLNLGNLYKYKKDYDKSIGIFKEGLEKYPKSARLTVHFGNTLRAKSEDSGKKPVEAIELYNKAKEINPDYAGSYLNLGFVYLSDGKGDLAQKEFLEAYKRNPNDPKLLSIMEQLGIK
jgi:tetratricopeptide (TPR) repeat protein